MADTPPMSAEDRVLDVLADALGDDVYLPLAGRLSLAKHLVAALSSERLAVVAQEDVQPRCPHCNGKLRRLSGADQDG